MADELRTEVEQVKQQKRRSRRIVEIMMKRNGSKGELDAGND